MKKWIAALLAKILVRCYFVIDEISPFGWCPSCGLRHILADEKGRPVFTCKYFKFMLENSQ